MRHILLSLSLASLSLLLGCQKKETVTPVDPIPGEYQMTGVTSYTIDGVKSTVPLSGTLSVFAGNAQGQYYFIERYSATELGYMTYHKNGSFTVQEVPDYTYLNQVKYYGYQKGTGTTVTRTIKITRSANTNTSTYIAPTGSSFNYTKDIKKESVITATR